MPRSDAGLGDRQRALAGFLKTETGADAVEITRIELLAGGAIQENWGIDASFAGGRLPGLQRLVLRTDAATGVPSSLGRIEEFQVLNAVFAAGVSVPEPLFACADETVIGKPFFVMRRVAGSAAGRPITLDPALESARPALAARLGGELARLQTVRPPRPDLSFLPPDDGPLPRIAGFRAYLDAHPNPRPVLEWALRWAERHLPEPLPPVLCHRDFRTGNYLLDGTRLTAIVDWEFTGWGDPDEDIGWLCCKGWRFGRLDREAGGVAERAPFYRGYEAESGRRLDPRRLRFWEVFANIRWAIIALQQSDRFLVGGARHLSTAITGRRATECELELLMLLDRAGPPSQSAPAGGGGGAGFRDLPTSRDLMALARELLLDELAPLLPAERRRDAHLIATVMAITARERDGEGWQEEIAAALAEFYDHNPAPTPPRLRGMGLAPSAQWSGWGYDDTLLRRFAADQRNGAFETSPSRAAASRAILWRLTMGKLREGNPHFLAANGLGEAT
ncbi:MAG TPA: phosphotransferase family protein [Stellaceae bacterium]|nr:phosphotransferase family protein [Stellaceae bacterium]